MIKSYAGVLKEDFYPYLNSISTDVGKYKYKYIFYIHKAPKEVRYLFNKFTMDYGCWRYSTNTNVVHYSTDSEILRNIYYFKDESVEDIPNDHAIFKQEQVEDIPIKNASAVNANYAPIRYTLEDFNQEYKCNEKGNKMNKDKFKAVYSVAVQVNGSQVILTDPINSDDALALVLKLSNRLKYLKDQLADLSTMKSTDDVHINTDKLTEVLTDEMDEIKEFIAYVNENLEDDD